MEYEFAHYNSLETIVDEISAAKNGRVERRNRDRNDSPQEKNATNRTFNTSLKKNSAEAATGSKRQKFNLREAVILSEILKPKFDE